MSPFNGDTRTSITGGWFAPSIPANNANLAEKVPQRQSRWSAVFSPWGFFCLKSGGTSE